MTTCLSPEAVNDSFIANIPLMQSTIKNMTIQSPSWFRDIYTPIVWPEGEGNIMQQHKFRGELPEVEEGFDSWNTVDDPSGCGDVCAPSCSYNMSILGGHSWETKITRLMTKDFRTPDYCVKNIQNTRQFREVFSAMIANMWNQINFQKEVNVGQNYLTGISKKLVADSAGFKSNPEDPWSFRPKGTKTLSALCFGGLSRLYETLRKMTDVMPFSFSNGMPVYAMVASPEAIAGLYEHDPNLKADVRAAAAGGGQYADDLIKKYNFTNTIRDMFLPVPYLYPRRFRYDTATDKWVRVLPFVKGVVGIAGTSTGVNPRYEDPSYATHEEILFHGKDPFTVFYQPTVQTIGEGTDFGPEPGFWDVFQWVNPQTREDPARREGFFFTTATIALSADNSEGVFSWLVPRPRQTVLFYPNNPCPPEAEACDNEVPDVGCPSPIIMSLTAHPLTAGHYFLVVAGPVDAAADDVIQLGHSNGGYVNATVVTASADQKTFEVTISGTLPVCDRWVNVYTGDTLGCTAQVRSYRIDPTDSTRLYLTLDRPVKADTNADAITLFYGDGTSVSATVVGDPDMINSIWRVDVGVTAFSDSVGGVKSVCVPTATDSSCAGCTGSYTTSTQCT